MTPIPVNAALPATMRAAMLLGPEQVAIRDVPLPRPGPGELLLEVRAALTCGTDLKVFRRGGHPRMLKVPALFGHEMAGTVAQLGAGVRAFQPGDAVVVTNSASCGECEACLSRRENLCPRLEYLNGAFAEYLLVPARFVARSTLPLPASLSFEEAALTEPLACVLHGVEACELARHAVNAAAEVAVYGAGPIGLLFTAALSRLGHRVILADPNPQRLKVGEALGAAECVPIERGGNQCARVLERTRDGDGAHIAVDCTGAPAAWEDALSSVRAGGMVNLFGGCAPGSEVRLDTHRVHYSELTVRGVYHHRPDNVRDALALLAEKSFNARILFSDERPIEELEQALESMALRKTLKVVIRKARTSARPD